MNETKKLKGRDLITIGIFSALYFILNLAAMITGFVPVLWLLLPGVTGVLAGIPFMLMESKVQKPGAILIMGLITAVLYFVTGQFTVLLLITFGVACVLSEVYRAITKYDNRFIHMAISFMMPCILAGILLVRNASMQKMIAAMRALHLPQGFITAISTTLRYFPAIREEFGHIRAAGKLQNIPLSERLEATVVPIMMSAVNTSDEIAAAAVVRGIENPCKKTSYIRLRITVSDWLIMALATLCTATTIWMGYRL